MSGAGGPGPGGRPEGGRPGADRARSESEPGGAGGPGPGGRAEGGRPGADRARSESDPGGAGGQDPADAGRRPVRVLIVDDSRLHRAAFRALLERAPGLEVAGAVADGLEAVEAVTRLRPDVLLMDVRMPGVDGLEATRRIMAERPTPILLMTAQDNLDKEVGLALRALELGALDLIAKPELAVTDAAAGQRLVARLRLLAGVPVISHPHGRRRPRPPAAEGEDPGLAKTTFHRRAGRIVVVAASTGGPSALKALLAGLPGSLPAAVVVVQHIDASFHDGLVRWLDEETPLTVVTPIDGQDLHMGSVYLAPQRRYCEVTERRRLALVTEPFGAGQHCPSGDRLFESAARAYGGKAVGVVLTGMGDDGARGLLALQRAGAPTIAQDEATSVIYGMPRAAAELGAADRVLPLERIAPAIVELLA